ncbi:PREDICTED: polycomb protein eed-like [Acropora digitifera]|uniref:polycomb protein eed-like n=1 Tax=Acropora digitifera TaxID=70779 RepID=UPI00077B174A|nr:PREDICTED: polycomb protein eed-like [Acropora digitifera]
MSDETVDPVQRESLIDEEGVGSDLDIERGAKEGKFDYEDSDNDSTVSSSNSTSTLPSTSNSGKRGYRGKGRKKRNLAFRCVNFLKEDHKQPIFAVQFNHNIPDGTDGPHMFATVGSNRVTIYHCEAKGVVKLLQAYMDADVSFLFLMTQTVILVEDFDILGEKMVSCGMDHSLKLWSLDSVAIQKAITASYSYDPGKTEKAFQTFKIHFPEFTTRDIHRNYVDCVRWFGDLILSKSCENSIVCWKPQEEFEEIFKGPFNSERSVTVLHRWVKKKMCFGSVKTVKILKLFHQTAVSLNVVDYCVFHLRSTTLVHNKCASAIRQTGFSKDGKILICVCDDGTLWRWDRVR